VFCRFFIDRPIFSAVISILITLAGGFSYFTLPLSQYPFVTPPTIQVDCAYPGASAEVVAECIAAPIEQQVNGVEDMLYMNSQSTGDGTYTLTVSFKPGTDLNLAQVRVMNRLNLAVPSLPDVVRATGVTTRRRSPEILLTVSLNSPTEQYDQLYISNYALTRVRDEMLRIPGIAEVLLFGQRDYAMRVWLDPDRLAARNLTALDVVNAIREQNTPIPLGQIGQPPTDTEPGRQLPLDTTGRLKEPEQYGDVIVKRDANGGIVRVKDVARVNLAAKQEDIANRFDRKPTVGLAVFLQADANALVVADTIKERVEVLKTEVPAGMVAEIGYDTSPYIRESIRQVFKTLREAVIIVAIVVLVFLRSWRSAIIPLATVPVAVIGTFGAMAAFGYSLNNLTLFGLVLAVGIVVDDAIVVVEAVEHHIHLGLAPREAAITAMGQVAGPVIAVGAVLSAVFVPCMFFPGIVGAFFRQFAVTIAVGTIISTINSLTLCPALAALLLKPKVARRDPLTWLFDNTAGWPLAVFHWGFDRLGRLYVAVIGQSIRPAVMVTLLAVYGGLVGGAAILYPRLPTGFIPPQDKGYLIASIALPDAASAERTRAAMDKMAKVVMDTPGVAHVNAVAGNSFVLSAYGSNYGSMFIILDEFKNRTTPDLYADAIIGTLTKKLTAALPEAQINIFGAPAVPGLGRAGGFRIMIEDRGEVGPKGLQQMTENFIEKANQQTHYIGRLFTAYKANSPDLFLDVDRNACLTRGVDLADVFGTLQATMGARYVNDFNRFGRTWQVKVQADQIYRNVAEDVLKLRVRNKAGEMVPLGAVLSVKDATGPTIITRYNMYPAAPVNGTVAVGASTGDAVAMLERLADQELPAPRMAYEWTEITYLEKQSSQSGGQLFALAVAFVFLVLAALYESWALPLAVILVVPMGVVSSLVGVWVAGHDVNVFTQVGFVVLIGLACKNAILIVEFAKLRRDEGADTRTAILDACQLRFRPIMMTSASFVFGVLPLVLAQGAGAEMRKVLGTAVFAGMIGVTLFGIVLTPVFFVLIDRLLHSRAAASRVGQLIEKTVRMTLGFGWLRAIVRTVKGRYQIRTTP
jgi:multidrug efflux pump